MLNTADKLLKGLAATTDYSSAKNCIIKVLSTEARFSFYLHNEVTKPELFRVNSLFSIPFAELCVSNEIEAKAQLDYRWGIADAIERLLLNNYLSSAGNFT